VTPAGVKTGEAGGRLAGLRQPMATQAAVLGGAQRWGSEKAQVVPSRAE